MKAVVVKRNGGPEELKVEQLKCPQQSDLKPNQLLVRVEYAGINYIDVYQREGLYPPPLPYTPGNEGAGVVVATGSDKTQFKVGDRVAFLSAGAYTEYAVVDSERVTACPDGDCKTGAALLLQGMTAVYLTRIARVERGSLVVVYAAAGGTGALVARLARSHGAKVIGVVGSESKVPIAKEYCDQVLIGYDSAELARFNGTADAVFDSLGKDTFTTSLALCKPGAHFVSYGNTTGPSEPFNPSSLKSVFYTRAALFDFIRTGGEFDGLAGSMWAAYKEGKIGVKIHAEYDLVDAAQAHADLQSRKTSGKLLLKIQ
jgi:NADPH2:quinone reductase